MERNEDRERVSLSVCVALFINNNSKPPTCTGTYVMRLNECVSISMRVCVCISKPANAFVTVERR